MNYNDSDKKNHRNDDLKEVFGSVNSVIKPSPQTRQKILNLGEPKASGIKPEAMLEKEIKSSKRRPQALWLTSAAALGALAIGGYTVLSQDSQPYNTAIANQAPAVSSTLGNPAEASTSTATTNTAGSTMEVVIWLDGETPETDMHSALAAINQKLVEHPSVLSYKFFSQEQAYVEFSEFYKKSPEILEAVEKNTLPISFYLELKTETDFPTFATEIKSASKAITSVELLENLEADTLEPSEPFRNISGESIWKLLRSEM